MSRGFATLVSFSLLAACGGQLNGERYIENVIDIIEHNSIRGSAIDWDSIRRTALNRETESPAIAETHDAVRKILAELNDKHSHLLTPDDLAALELTASGSVKVKEAPMPSSVALTERISYVGVPSFVGSSREQVTAFADGVQERIAAVDSDSVCGWIIDLRDNPGGNVWPMLAGIGPLLSEGVVSGYVYPNGRKVDVWYRNGEAGVVSDGIFGRRSTVEQASISGEPYVLKQPNAGLAVIVGPRTASSGELVAISLIGAANTRIFGSETLGLTTNNDSFPLEDGSILVLATSVMADRTGRTYGGSIQPEPVIASELSEAPIDEQAVIEAASQWLQDQPACQQKAQMG